jgi:hypothetical protein
MRHFFPHWLVDEEKMHDHNVSRPNGEYGLRLITDQLVIDVHFDGYG